MWLSQDHWGDHEMTDIAEMFAELRAGTLKMRCVKCGTEGVGFNFCGCWEKCSCGWTADAGQQCRNPDTIRCSTKVKYGKWNRKTKRYEPKETESGITGGVTR